VENYGKTEIILRENFMETEQIVNLAIDNIIKEGLNDIYPASFEVEMLKDTEFRNAIINVTLAKLKKSSIDEMFFPLGIFLFF
jgi:hypothetical protein